MKYLISTEQIVQIVNIGEKGDTVGMIKIMRALKPIEPLSDEQIYAIWPYPEGTNSVQTLARAIEAHILGEKHDRE